jgi:hypothetical protein
MRGAVGPRVAKAGRGRGATSEDEAHQRPELHDGRSDWAALPRCIRYFSRVAVGPGSGIGR